MKTDETDGTKRKLSKRKDPEASVSYFAQSGYPEALTEYIMTLLNSNFEDWRRANKTAYKIGRMSPGMVAMKTILRALCCPNILTVRSVDRKIKG